MAMVMPAPPLAGSWYALARSPGPKPAGVTNGCTSPVTSLTRTQEWQRKWPAGALEQTFLCRWELAVASGLSVLNSALGDSVPPQAVASRASTISECTSLERAPSVLFSIMYGPLPGCCGNAAASAADAP